MRNKLITEILGYLNTFKESGRIYAGRLGVMRYQTNRQLGDELLHEHPYLDIHCHLLGVNPDFTVDEGVVIPDQIPDYDYSSCKEFVHPYKGEVNDLSNQKQEINSEASGSKDNSASPESRWTDVNQETGDEDPKSGDSESVPDDSSESGSETLGAGESQQLSSVESESTGSDANVNGLVEHSDGDDSGNAGDSIEQGELGESDEPTSGSDSGESESDETPVEESDQGPVEENVETDGRDGTSKSIEDANNDSTGSEDSGSGSGDIGGSGDSGDGSDSINLKDMDTAQLKAECKRLGVGQSGTRKQMIARIEKKLAEG